MRWYSESTAFFLLFFDPDKPVTMGETLSIRTQALAFALLYWNLSKVIPLKDLPRIYTMRISTNNHRERPRHVARRPGRPLSVSATSSRTCTTRRTCWRCA